MSVKTEKTIKALKDAIQYSDKKGTQPYDTTATVVRIEDGIAWVHLDGGVQETPARMTINANVGDEVQVRIGGGNAWLVGNATAPPTDDTKASHAIQTANDAHFSARVAREKAEEAIYDAERARTSADEAETLARSAEQSASQAQTSATNAQTSANNAQRSADNAQTSANNAQTSADNAQISANNALQSATQAETHAQEALTQAQNATEYATSALISLSTVEDVVGVLNWITAHGTMTLTTDTAIDPTHVYFVVDSSGDYVVGGTHYSLVTDPQVSELSTYYQLSIDESLQNYVATHVAVTSEGLWLIPDSGGNKVLIATGAGTSYPVAGTYIIGKVNGVDTVFARFTQSGATMSAENGTQIAHLGYASGQAESGTAVAPYYTFGDRSGTIGNYSITEGKNVVIEDSGQTYTYPISASGYVSHAEGGGTTASGNWSHVEGYQSEASGFGSHAEGDRTIASGQGSHAQNYETIARGANQTALGKYNVEDTTSAVIIGNGTSSARSNALTVDWDGNVNIASGAKYKINGNDLSKSDIGLGNVDNTSDANKPISTAQQTALDGKVSKTGDTMTGQLLTSFNSSVAMGSYGATATTVPNLVEELRFSSGCMGSANIGTAYSASGYTIATGWYNFIYTPHRSGGVNGQASGDNCNYGNLFLLGMNNNNGQFIIRVANGAIAQVIKLVEENTLSNYATTSALGSYALKTDLDSYIKTSAINDYITSQGSTNGWYWRKYKSKKCELWKNVTQTVSAYAQDSFILGSNDTSTTKYPFTISSPITQAYCRKIGTGGGFISYDYDRTDYWRGIAFSRVPIAQGTSMEISYSLYVRAIFS